MASPCCTRLRYEGRCWRRWDTETRVPACTSDLYTLGLLRKLRPLLLLGLLAAELKASLEGGETGLQGLQGNLAQPGVCCLMAAQLTCRDPQKIPSVFFLQYPAPIFIHPDGQALPLVGITS